MSPTDPATANTKTATGTCRNVLNLTFDPKFLSCKNTETEQDPRQTSEGEPTGFKFPNGSRNVSKKTKTLRNQKSELSNTTDHALHNGYAECQQI